jgi:hypothetical protein
MNLAQVIVEEAPFGHPQLGDHMILGHLDAQMGAHAGAAQKLVAVCAARRRRRILFTAVAVAEAVATAAGVITAVTVVTAAAAGDKEIVHHLVLAGGGPTHRTCHLWCHLKIKLILFPTN